MTGDARKIASWAAGRGMRFHAAPDAAWYQQWEPFDTMVAPSSYVNSVVATFAHGHVVVVEPWNAQGQDAPLDRTLLGFATHEGLRFRAAARCGAWFNTRVAFVGSARPNEVTVGDAAWDGAALTFAMTSQHAAAAFHPGLRRMLLARRFQGHIELRTGGLVLHVAGLRPVAADYERLWEVVQAVVANAVAYPV